MATINFFSQDLPFKLKNPRKTQNWIKKVLLQEKKNLEQLNYIFCTDKYLLEINQHYLKHKTLTDIITFDNSEKKDLIEGDVFISIERVMVNAKEFSNTLDEEVHRVIIHGVLHLIGYSDKSESEKIVMRKKEDTYLSLRRF